MKLRIKGNTLRLRLTQGEVARLAAQGDVVEQMQLPGAALTYSIHATGEAMAASLDGNTLGVTVPAALVQSWAGSDEVSLQAMHGPLKILVEKDFACLVPREGDDDADAYPHPGKAHC